MRKTDLFLALVIFLISFSIRLYGLGGAVMVDEVRWLDRSYSFWVNVKKGNLGATHQSGHPGVITMMITSGTSMSIYRLINNQPYSRARLLEFLPVARFPIILIICSFLAIIYNFLRQIFGRRIAFFSVLLLSIDPFFLSFSRIVHVDGLLSVFVISSILSFLIYIRKKDERHFIYSATFAGLAFLTKTPSIVLIPFVGFSLLAREQFKIEKIKEVIMKSIKWIVIAVGLFYSLWPALWVAPAKSMYDLFDKGGYHVVMPHKGTTYTLDVQYYPSKIYFHSSPFIITFLFIFSVLFLLRLVRNKTKFVKQNINYIALLGFGLIFILLFTIGAKKGERYILPAYLTFPIFSITGLFWLLAFLRSRILKITISFLTALLVTAQFIKVIDLSPNYIAYYNQLLSSPTTAKLGFGEGLDEAAYYLNQKANSQELIVSSWYPEIFSSYFDGKTVSLAKRNDAGVSYVVLYRGMLGRSVEDKATEIINEYRQKVAEKTIFVNGLEYIWIYKNLEFNGPS